ncbi:MAG TPA: type II toxin-antitoxin system prevent-host-death family antitoxin [Thermoanaerobaculia bacterium]|jgi:prevent-host-death family protein|nr:type II toxin-antitoxin system prevent-host-death family antitoxin [Thermoanaerobaculia bacterium]
MDMTEKIVSVSELKAHLSECLRRVKEGEQWTVTERGRVIAVLGPSSSLGDELDELAAVGAVRLGNRRLSAKFWAVPPPEDPDDAVRRAVIEERAGGW